MSEPANTPMTSSNKTLSETLQLTPSLSHQLMQAAQRPVDVLARQRAVMHWLDWMGCVAAGTRSPVGQVLQNLRMQTGAALGTPSLLGMAQDAYQAMLMDAGPANVEEMDDMHRQAILHPGPVVMPAVASLARGHQLNAAQTLDAVVRGYEVMIRVGRAVGAHHYYFWHNTATAGVFGAAAACASALQLPLEQAVWALGNAGTQAAGLWQVRMEPVMSKQLHTGHAAWAGMTSATLAAAGLTGPQYILEGERGFFAAMCPGANLEIINQLESDWLIHSTSFKPWPACRHTHATIDCVMALRERLGRGPLNYVEAVVETFADAVTICDKPWPTNRTEAKFSLQYAVAASAHWGTLLPTHFDEEQFSEPTLRAAATVVELCTDGDLTRAYPAHFGARVTVKLADGSTHTESVIDAFGDPERPMATQELLDKARHLMAYGGVAPARAQAAIDAALDLQMQIENNPHAAFPSALLDPLF